MDRLKQLSLQVEPVSGNLFSHVTMAPPDPILGTAQAFQKDTSSDKINLGIGAYRDGQGKPYVFQAVKDAEALVQKANHNKVQVLLFRNTCPLKDWPVSALAAATLSWAATPCQSRRRGWPPARQFQGLGHFTSVSDS